MNPQHLQVLINSIAVSCGDEKPEESLIMPMPLQESTVELNCLNPFLGLASSLTFNILLVVACSYYAFKTRSLPDNFNESRCIVLCIYTTFVIWLVSIPSYLTTTKAYHQSIVLAAALLLNSSVALMTLYAPKIYAVTHLNPHNPGSNPGEVGMNGPRCCVSKKKIVKKDEEEVSRGISRYKNMVNKVGDNSCNQAKVGMEENSNNILSLSNFDRTSLKLLVDNNNIAIDCTFKDVNNNHNRDNDFVYNHMNHKGVDINHHYHPNSNNIDVFCRRGRGRLNVINEEESQVV